MNKLFQDEMPFGTVTIGNSADVTYSREEGGIPIQRVDVSCGCSQASWSADSTFVKIVYNAPTSWPEGVWGDEMIVDKYATVIFADSSSQVLKLSGKVIR